MILAGALPLRLPKHHQNTALHETPNVKETHKHTATPGRHRMGSTSKAQLPCRVCSHGKLGLEAKGPGLKAQVVKEHDFTCPPAFSSPK